MKSIRFTRPGAAAADAVPDRRGLIVGVGIVGVAAVAARALHRPAPPAAAAADAGPPAGDAGYRATAHVLRYYETAKS